MTFSDRLDEAFSLAHRLHREQTRKGTGLPYMTHLMGAASIVGDYGGTEDQVIAALLHDAVEDQGGLETLEHIKAEFGETVAEYVVGATDAYVKPKPAWRARKEAFIARTESAPAAVKLIVAADKLHNMRSILRDYEEQQETIWDLFNTGKEGTLWYYGEMIRALAVNWPHPIMLELAEVFDKVHRKACAHDHHSAHRPAAR